MITFKSVHELDDFINQNHSSFAGHKIIPFGCANVDTFGTLMRALDYLKAEKSARSLDFDAEHMHMGKIIHTTITIGIDDNGITYTEHIKH